VSRYFRVWPLGFWILLFLTACQLGVQTTAAPPITAPPPTAITLASDTPLPVFTVTSAPPTLTLAPPPLTATPAPQVTATPDPNLGVGDVVYEDKLDGSSGWRWGFVEEGVVTFSTAGGQLDAVMLQPNVGPRFTVSPDTAKVGDQQVRVTARANLCYRLDEYGLMFRGRLDSNNNYQTYVFKLNCDRAARVEILQSEGAQVLVDWTTSPAFVGGAPAENMLVIWMAKDQFHFYVNDRYLFSLQDAALAEGFYGFYIRDRTNGGESVSFSNLTAKEVKMP